MYKSLQNIDLSENEIKIYLALLKLHKATVSEISKKTRVYRSNCYDALNQLIELGLAGTAIIDGKKYYTSTNPENIKRVYQEKEKIMQKELPQLKRIYNSSRTIEELELFTGKEGVKTILEEINEYSHYDAFGITSNLGKIVPVYFKIWLGDRYRKKLTANMIKTTSDKLLTPQIFGLKVYTKLFKVKNLPDEFYSPAATFVYGEKVAIILENVLNPLGVVINNKEIAKSYKKQFNLLWKIAKKEDFRKFKGIKPEIKLE